jgi:hypothetical protein
MAQSTRKSLCEWKASLRNQTYDRKYHCLTANLPQCPLKSIQLSYARISD